MRFAMRSSPPVSSLPMENDRAFASPRKLLRNSRG
jgi:hypothetical protein